MKLEDFEKLVEDWRETVDDYNREYSEGMEHERGYSFAKRMCHELDEAVVLFPRMIKALKTAKLMADTINKLEAKTGYQTIVTINGVEYRVNFTAQFHEAFAELEQP